MNDPSPQGLASARAPWQPGFQIVMALASSILLPVLWLTCVRAGVYVNVPARLIGLLVITLAYLPLPAFHHHRLRGRLRDAALTLPWAVLVALATPMTVLAAARVRRPLCDDLFLSLDRSLGVSAPAIHEWASHHLAGLLISRTYPLVGMLLLAAIFVPALTGKVDEARGFITGNIFALGLAIPCFALFPAVGPWVPGHFAPTAFQATCQQLLLQTRLPGSFFFTTQQGAIICFPSYHVIFTLLSARALWGFRFARIPLGMLSMAIILSTLTTGWHYFVDVLGGMMVAGLSVLAANWLNGYFARQDRASRSPAILSARAALAVSPAS